MRISRPRFLVRAGILGVIVSAIAAFLFLDTVPASAAPASLTNTYDCSWPSLIPSDTVQVTITANMPEDAAAPSVQPQSFGAVVGVPAVAAAGMSLVGAARLTETEVSLPSTETLDKIGGGTFAAPLPLRLSATDTTVRAGAFVVVADAQAPDIALPTGGTVLVSVGNSLTMTATAVDVDGNPVSQLTGPDYPAGSGRFDMTCTLPPDATRFLGSFPIASFGSCGSFPDAGGNLTSCQINPEYIFDYSVKGSTHLESANADVPIDGADLHYTIPPNALDLQNVGGFLNLSIPTSFTVLGFIPVTLDVSNESAGGFASFYHGELAADISVSIGVQKVSVFGIAVYNAPQGTVPCHSSAPFDIPLTSDPQFNLQSGGTLKGTYTLTQFTGCGLITPLLNLATKGADTISLDAVGQQPGGGAVTGGVATGGTGVTGETAIGGVTGVAGTSS